MSTHNIYFQGELQKIITESSIFLLIKSSAALKVKQKQRLSLHCMHIFLHVAPDKAFVSKQ